MELDEGNLKPRRRRRAVQSLVDVQAVAALVRLQEDDVELDDLYRSVVDEYGSPLTYPPGLPISRCSQRVGKLLYGKSGEVICSHTF